MIGVSTRTWNGRTNSSSPTARNATTNIQYDNVHVDTSPTSRRTGSQNTTSASRLNGNITRTGTNAQSAPRCTLRAPRCPSIQVTGYDWTLKTSSGLPNGTGDRVMAGVMMAKDVASRVDLAELDDATGM